MRRGFVCAIVAAVCLTLLGCAQTADLEPAPAARQAPVMGEAAVSEVNDVRMVVRADAWTGRADVRQHVTPLKVSVENDSGMPLRVRYQEFALLGPDGTRYNALPPFEIEGDVSQPRVATTGPFTPAFTSTAFQVAPFYGPAYPGFGIFSDPFYYDPLYYDRYYTYWRDIPLPTQEMIEQALPEGVLDSGGRLSGFLYFEEIPADAPRVRFRADLVNARTGDQFGTISIPFMVED